MSTNRTSTYSLSPGLALGIRPTVAARVLPTHPSSRLARQHEQGAPLPAVRKVTVVTWGPVVGAKTFTKERQEHVAEPGRDEKGDVKSKEFIAQEDDGTAREVEFAVLCEAYEAVAEETKIHSLETDGVEAEEDERLPGVSQVSTPHSGIYNVNVKRFSKPDSATTTARQYKRKVKNQTTKKKATPSYAPAFEAFLGPSSVDEIKADFGQEKLVDQEKVKQSETAREVARATDARVEENVEKEQMQTGVELGKENNKADEQVQKEEAQATINPSYPSAARRSANPYARAAGHAVVDLARNLKEGSPPAAKEECGAGVRQGVGDAGAAVDRYAVERGAFAQMNTKQLYARVVAVRTPFRKSHGYSAGAGGSRKAVIGSSATPPAQSRPSSSTSRTARIAAVRHFGLERVKIYENLPPALCRTARARIVCGARGPTSFFRRIMFAFLNMLRALLAALRRSRRATSPANAERESEVLGGGEMDRAKSPVSSAPNLDGRLEKAKDGDVSSALSNPKPSAPKASLAHYLRLLRIILAFWYFSPASAVKAPLPPQAEHTANLVVGAVAVAVGVGAVGIARARRATEGSGVGGVDGDVVMKDAEVEEEVDELDSDTDEDSPRPARPPTPPSPPSSPPIPRRSATEPSATLPGAGSNWAHYRTLALAKRDKDLAATAAPLPSSSTKPGPAAAPLSFALPAPAQLPRPTASTKKRRTPTQNSTATPSLAAPSSAGAASGVLAPASLSGTPAPKKQKTTSSSTLQKQVAWWDLPDAIDELDSDQGPSTTEAMVEAEIGTSLPFTFAASSSSAYFTPAASTFASGPSSDRVGTRTRDEEDYMDVDPSSPVLHRHLEPAPSRAASPAAEDEETIARRKAKGKGRLLDDEDAQVNEEENAVEVVDKARQHPCAAFLSFVDSLEPSLSESYPSLSKGEVLKKVGLVWQSMTREEREPWVAQFEVPTGNLVHEGQIEALLKASPALVENPMATSSSITAVSSSSFRQPSSATPATPSFADARILGGHASQRLKDNVLEHRDDLRAYERQRYAERQEERRPARRAQLEAEMEDLVQDELRKVRDFESQLAETADEPPLDRIAAVTSVALASNGRQAIDLSATSALGKMFREPSSASLVNGLLRLATEGGRIDLDDEVAAGWLREVSREEVELGGVAVDDEGDDEEEEDAEVAEGSAAPSISRTGEVYLRTLSMRAKDWISLLEEHCARRPSDRHRLAPMLAQARAAEAEEILTFPYAGQSFRWTAAGRAAEDEEEKPATFYQHLISLSPSSVDRRYFQVAVPPTVFSVSSSRSALNAAFRACAPLQDLEILLIALLTRGRLNSALGGAAPTFLPSSTLVSLRDSLLASLAELPPQPAEIHPRKPRVPAGDHIALAEERRKKQALIEQHVLESIELWAAQDEQYEPPSETATTDIVRNAAAFALTPDGYADSLVVLKDITVEAFRTTEDEGITFFGPRGGQAAQSLRAFDCFVKGKELDIASTEALFSFVDLWAVILVHRDIVLAIILLIRAMVIIDSPCVRLDSAKTAFHAFLATLDVSFSNDLFDRELDLGSWPEQALRDFYKEVGRVVVAPIHPFEGGCRIFLLTGHAGQLKYDPSVEQAVSRLLVAADLKYQILVAVCRAYRPETSESALIAVRHVVESMADETGVNEEISAAKEDLGQRYRVLRGLRQLQRMSVSGGKEEDGDGEEEADEEETTDDERRRRVWEAMDRAERLQMLMEKKGGPSISKAALGRPNSTERAAQVDQLEDQHLQAQQRGAPSPAPQPIGLDVGSSKWREWLGGLSEGVELRGATVWQGRMAQPEVRALLEARWARLADKRRSEPSIRKKTTSREERQACTVETALLRLADLRRPRHGRGEAASELEEKKKKKAVRPQKEEAEQEAGGEKGKLGGPLREAYDFNVCRNSACGGVWVSERRNVRSHGDHACDPVQVDFDHTRFAEDPSVVKLDNPLTRRTRQQNLLRRARGFAPVTAETVLSIPLFYAHQLYDILHLSPADLPPTLAAYPCSSIIPSRTHPSLPDPLRHALERRGLDIADLGLGPIIDVANEVLEDPSSRRAWREHQVVARLIVALGGDGPVSDGTGGAGAVSAGRGAADEPVFWESGTRAQTLLDAAAGARSAAGSKAARKERAELFHPEEQAVGCAYFFRCDEVADPRDCVALVRGTGTASKIQLTHSYHADAPSTSIHSFRKQQGRQLPSLHPLILTSFLAVPHTAALRLHLATWAFNNTEIDPYARDVAALESKGKSLLGWGDVSAKRTPQIQALIERGPVRLDQTDDKADGNLVRDEQGTLIPEHFAVPRVDSILPWLSKVVWLLERAEAQEYRIGEVFRWSSCGKFVLVDWNAGVAFSRFLFRSFGHEKPIELQKALKKYNFVQVDNPPSTSLPSPSLGTDWKAYIFSPPTPLASGSSFSRDTYTDEELLREVSAASRGGKGGRGGRRKKQAEQQESGDEMAEEDE
ncbi:hypothetical protein JCM10213v2_007331 [Rhodosporidiobolus nylandii]